MYCICVLNIWTDVNICRTVTVTQISHKPTCPVSDAAHKFVASFLFVSSQQGAEAGLPEPSASWRGIDLFPHPILCKQFPLSCYRAWVCLSRNWDLMNGFWRREAELLLLLNSSSWDSFSLYLNVSIFVCLTRRAMRTATVNSQTWRPGKQHICSVYVYLLINFF